MSNLPEYAPAGQVSNNKSLVVCLDGDQWLSIPFEGSPKPLEGYPMMLEKLELDVLPLRDVRSVFNTASQGLLSFPLPNLRELRVDFSRNIRGVVRADNLRVLRVCRDEGDFGYMHQDLLQTMRHMPHLEVVELHYAFPYIYTNEDIDALSSIEAIHLPKLKALKLNDRAPILPHLLSLVANPVEAKLAVSCDVWDSQEVSAFIASLQPKLIVATPNGPSYRSIRSLSIKTIADGGYNAAELSLSFEGYAHGHVCSCTKDGEHASPDLSVTFAYVNSEQQFINLNGFAEFLELLPLHEVKLLHIKGQDVWNSLQARLGLLAWDEVAFTPVHLQPITYHMDYSPTAKNAVSEFESRIRQLFPNIKTFCIDMSPEEEMYTLPWGRGTENSDSEESEMNVDEV